MKAFCDGLGLEIKVDVVVSAVVSGLISGLVGGVLGGRIAISRYAVSQKSDGNNSPNQSAGRDIRNRSR